MPTRGLVAAGLVLMLAACASRVAPPAAPAVNRYPDFVYPTVPAALQQSPGVEHIEPGWRFLQSGDTRNAAREFQAALKRNPRLYPAHAGDGYAALAREDHSRALTEFDAALRDSSAYVPALIGRGQTLLQMKRDVEALTALIHEDATQSMPPYDLWLAGRDDIFEWWFGPGIGCAGSRVIPTRSANGSPG